MGCCKTPDFAASSVSDRVAFAYSSSRNRTAHVPSREKLGIYRFHFRAVRSLQSGLSTNNRAIRALFAYFSAERTKILCSSDCMAERVGFEPTLPFRVNTLSKRAPSATRPSLRRVGKSTQLPEGYCIGLVGCDFHPLGVTSFYGSRRTSANQSRIVCKNRATFKSMGREGNLLNWKTQDNS
jgi:hypothetical protein